MDELQKKLEAVNQEYEVEKTKREALERQVIELQRQLEANQLRRDELMESKRTADDVPMGQQVMTAAQRDEMRLLDGAAPNSDGQEQKPNTFVSNDWSISKESYERVMITASMGYGDYFVEIMKFCNEAETMFEDLKAHAAATKIRIKPVVNQICILQHQRGWHRVFIQEIRDFRMKILLIDMGMFVETFVRNVIPIDGFETPMCYAGRITLDANTNSEFMKLQMGSEIHVKSIGISDNGTPIVEVLEDIKEKAVKKIENFPNVLDKLKIRKNNGILILNSEIGNNKVTASLVPEDLKDSFQSLQEDLSKACKIQVAQNSDYEPAIGDFVCGEYSSNKWLRGIVMNFNPIKLAAIDDARVFHPLKCTPVPKDYHDILSFGVTVKLTNSADVVGKTLEFKVLKDLPTLEFKDLKDFLTIYNSVAVSLTGNDEQAYNDKANLIKWLPNPDQMDILWAKLTNGCKVKIISASSQNQIFVCTKEDEEEERRNLVEKEIDIAALCKGSLPRGLPFVGQFVMVHCEDVNKYYRAYVVKVNSKTNIKIMYMDYGKEANVNFENLYELPVELIEERACLARINLKGIKENISMTRKAMDYLAELIAREVILTCTFIGNPVIDGVVLKTPENDIVNDNLSAFLKPKTLMSLCF